MDSPSYTYHVGVTFHHPGHPFRFIFGIYWWVCQNIYIDKMWWYWYWYGYIYIQLILIYSLILVWLKLVATKMVEEFRTRETITRETSNQWICFPDAPCMESLPLGNMWETYPLIRAHVGQYSIHGACGFHYPLVSCYWKWPIEIVDLPSYKMVDLSSSFLYVYQRVPIFMLIGNHYETMILSISWVI